MPVPGRYRTVVQHLLLRVQQVFPDVTGDAIDNYVMSAFPSCAKFINKKNGLAYYQGLIGRPDVSCICIQVPDNPDMNVRYCAVWQFIRGVKSSA